MSACRFDVDVLPICDSTNAVLLTRAEAGAPSGAVVVAETQTAGRGRRGRSWVSSPGDSLTFSLLWRFAPGVALSGLSLAVGLAVVKALEPHAADLALKWPNDVLRRVDGAWRKLGGILIELQPGLPQSAVIGIGLNLRVPRDLPDDLRATTTALDVSLEPTVVLAEILKSLALALDGFAAHGFAGVQAEWMQRHAFQDRAVRLSSDFGTVQEGVCRGVDSDGALLLETVTGVARIISGEVSLREAA